MATIICGVDASSGAREALRAAGRLARATGSELLVVHADAAAVGSDDEQLHIEQARDHAARLVSDELLDGIAQPVGIVGDPGAALVELAERERATAIFVGARSRGRSGTDLRSRTAQQLARHTDVPVIVVTPRPADLAVEVAGDAPPAEPMPALPMRRRRRRRRMPARSWSARAAALRPRPSAPS